ncbi:methionine--tRNA ligase [Candidatus Gracilibacteria bacterium]|nr:methionine--tRNA ligase [Candidatus Gracilibacteria bacterium]
MPKIYFTTPIYYVNDVPHIGHAYCTLATDTLARFWRKKIGSENVFFLTGTDENSQKTVEAAQKAGKDVSEYLDEMADNWKKTWEKIGISNDDFIRTTGERHQKVVHEIFQKIYDKGDIYKGKYIGKYCTGCEAFLKDSDLDEAGNCPDHKKPPQEIEEENYFFRLSNYQDKLLEMYDKNPKWVLPESRKNEVLNFIKSGLEDISVSRETAEFGITLPMDEKHKVYVWFDALINYYSALEGTGKEGFWNVAHHIVGKDIIKFHCVIWPAMLLSAEIPPAKEVFGHGFFTVDGVKMSKSLGNVVNPLEISEKYGNDALRLFLLSAFEFGNDGDFSVENLGHFYNAKLAGGVGNLFNRVIVLIHKFLKGYKEFDQSETKETQETREKFGLLMEAKKLKAAIDFFFETVDSANKLLNESEVWKMAKVDSEGAKKVFAIILQKLESLVEMAEVLLPEVAPRMKEMLGNEKKIGNPQILFEKR